MARYDRDHGLRCEGMFYALRMAISRKQEREYVDEVSSRAR